MAKHIPNPHGNYDIAPPTNLSRRSRKILTGYGLKIKNYVEIISICVILVSSIYILCTTPTSIKQTSPNCTKDCFIKALK
jgi:hypothetical protein